MPNGTRAHVRDTSNSPAFSLSFGPDPMDKSQVMCVKPLSAAARGSEASPLSLVCTFRLRGC